MQQGFFIALLSAVDVASAATIESLTGHVLQQDELDRSAESLERQNKSRQYAEAAGRTAIIRSSGEIDVNKPVKALPVAVANAQGDAIAKATVGVGGMKKAFAKEGKYLKVLSQKFPYEKKVVQILIGQGKGTGLCLDAKDNTKKGSHLQLFDCAGGGSSTTRKHHQEWVYDDKTGKISNFKSGLCLEAPNRNTEDTPVRLWTCVYTKDPGNDHYQGQMWTYDAVLVQIRNKEGICLRTANPNKKNEPVVMWSCDGVDKGQKWGMLKVGGPV